MKSILFCQPTLNSTGSENSLLQIVKGLSEKHNIYLLAGQNGVMYNDFEKYCNTIYIGNSIKLKKSYKVIIPYIISYFKVYFMIKRICKQNKIDIVYINSLMFPQALVGAFFNKVNIITHIREVQTTYPKIVYNIYILLTTLLTKRIVNACDFIGKQKIPLSEKFKEKAVTIYNCSDFNVMQNKDINSSFTILSVIPASKKKGIIDLIYCVDEMINVLKIKNVSFQVVGKIDEKSSFFLKLKEIIFEKKISNNITFVGESQNIEYFYSKADILLHPSHSEAFPRAIIEGMNYSLPIIATNVGGSSEAVINGENGYIVEKGNYKDMANKISQLINEKDKLSSFSRKSYELYRSFFTNEIMTKKILDVIKKVND